MKANSLRDQVEYVIFTLSRTRHASLFYFIAALHHIFNGRFEENNPSVVVGIKNIQTKTKKNIRLLAYF